MQARLMQRAFATSHAATQDGVGHRDMALPSAGLADLVGIVRRRFGLIAIIVALSTGFAIWLGLQVQPRFTAIAEIVLEPRHGELPTGGLAPPDAVMNPSLAETRIKFLTSSDHLRRVLASLEQASGMFPALEMPPPSGPDHGERLRRNENGWLERAWQDPALPVMAFWSRLTRSGQWRPPPADPVPPSLDDLEKGLKVFQEGTSYVIAVSYSATTPSAAAAVANHVVDLYLQEELARRRRTIAQASGWLDDQLVALKAQLEQAESAVQGYRITHRIAEGNRLDVTNQQLTDGHRELTEAEADLATRQARLDHVQTLQRQGAVLAIPPEFGSSPGLLELRRRELELQSQLTELSLTFGDKHPRIQLIRTQLSETRQKIGQEIAQEIARMEGEVQLAAAKVRTIRDRLANVQQASSVTQQAEVGLHELEREAEASRRLYENLLQQQKEIQLATDSIQPDTRILSRAMPPDRPSSPPPILFAIPGMVASGVGGILLVVLLERLDRGLRSARQVQQELGLRCIGLVPRLRWLGRKRPHQYLAGMPLSIYTEALRSIFVALPGATRDYRPTGIVLVTSSRAGEGKTTLAVSLATYASLAGKRVLLIDLDLRHPSVARELGVKPRCGLVEYLCDERALDEVVHQLPGTNLHYISIVRRPVDPLSLVSGQGLAAMLQRMRMQYDWIIVDSAPLLGITESSVLAQLVDSVLFATRWGSTSRDIAGNALEILEEASQTLDRTPPGIYSVLTQVNIRQHARYRYGDAGEAYHRYNRYYAN
ncbi:GumC family protein [Geminicoccus roseus]|uniref:GumC family protein n=1 Tax=Geminicoccus roseus TaxID=404900 RepID=UPI0003FE6C0D|nr:polysaccharide biosynthesis tyrosine autokinase [Geminicoccus roseus]